MPINKSTSKKAFGENVAAEMHAGRPQKQSVAIAYAVKREAEHPHHSDHSARRSQHYHQHVAEPIRTTRIGRGATKMTRAEQQISNLEESGESDEKS